MDINEATAKALSAERAASGLTIKELSEESGIPERTLIRVLKGERDINMLQIAKLAPIYGMQPHEIVVEAEQYIVREKRNDVA
ncbi:helix-turn-helix domain-containing protein [Bifidobacterium pseudolongum]|uniref:helix-turn-helix domain-containing protein n=1 Tax=Bifidobacterium pseudolongum TaxID=1694 RepID=UPI0022E33906|nr:helix-turn-helix transcriptional regulator [Bifidobacterium pseudolongum]